MNAQLEDRVGALERQVALLTGQLALRDALAPPPSPVAAVVPEPLAPEPRWNPVPTVAAEPPAHAPRWIPAPQPDSEQLGGMARPQGPVRASGLERLTSRRREQGARDLEDLLGGRLLGLVGGLSVLIGIAFFVALAIDHGWIGETARVGLAAGGSCALFAGGVWLYERRGRSQAALAMVGAAVAGLFLTLAAATALYELVPLPVALPFAFGIGAVATTVAVRWDARTVAGLGIGGTLLVPVLGNALTTEGMAFLAVAAASAAGVLVWRRWPWLAVGATALTLAQVAVWAVGDVRPAALVSVLAVFAGLNLALALGFELRSPSARLEPSSALLVPFGALILGALGYFGLPHGEGELAGGLWLVALAVAHAALAGVAFGLRRVSNEIGLVLLGAAVILADVAFGLLATGWVLGVGWAASAVVIAAAARHYTGREELIQLTLGSQLALSVAHVLLFDAQPQLLVDGGGPGPGPLAALAAVLVASFASARLLVDDERGAARMILDALTMAALAYTTALSLDAPALLLAWAATSIALARAAERFDDRVAGLGALGFLTLLAAHVLAFEAPPSALVYGLDAPATAALGLLLVGVCAAVCARVDPTRAPDERVLLGAITGVALLYLGSTEIVTLFQPGGPDARPDSPLAIDTGMAVGVRQQGQAVLSAFWGVCGFAALWVGLRARIRVVRLGGLGLLCLATAKVFLYDLSTLGSDYRVASFIALGLLLLTAAFVHQRMRATS